MGSIWDLYTNRTSVRGNTKRETVLNREKHFLNTKLPDSLSYQQVTIDDVGCNVAIINSDNLDEKTIISLDGEIYCGGLISWMDNYWLITELDANTEVYTKAKMRQCNYLLRWVDNDGKICEQWCIVEDGTKLKIAFWHSIVWHTGNGM